MQIGLVIFWAVLSIILIIIEISSVGLFAIWFALGGIVAFIVSFFNGSFLLQLVLFTLTSIIFLIFTRPFLKKYINNAHVATNVDRLIGQSCIIRQPINNIKDTGRAYVDSLEWNARSDDDSVTFEVDEVATIVAIQGVKLIVKKSG